MKTFESKAFIQSAFLPKPFSWIPYFAETTFTYLVKLDDD